MIVQPSNAQPLENLMFIFGIPVCFWIGANAQERKSGTSQCDYGFLTGACFFVYCIHMVNFGNWNLLSWANHIGAQIFNLDNPIIAAIAYLSEIALIMAVGILAYWLLKRFLPRLSGIITGGR